MSEPAISVIIPARNASDTLPECLAALENQTVPRERYEVIVVDDGSSDQTSSVAQRDGVVVVRQPHMGPAAARNRGAEVAQGDVLLFLDADCVPSPDWIEQMVSSLSEDGVVGAKGRYETRQRGVVARFAQLEFEEKYARLARHRYIDFVDTYSAAFRRDVFQKERGFDTSFPYWSAEDVEFSFRLAIKGYRMVFNPKATVFHRHASRLWPYLRKKFRYGYWRVTVYRRYPGKLVRDSYTPRTLPVQIVLAGAVAATWTASIFVPQSRILAGALSGAFLLSTLPFLISGLRRDLPVALISPGLIFLRSLAQGAGLALGLAMTLLGRAGDAVGESRTSYKKSKKLT